MAEVRKPELPFRWRVRSPGRLGRVCPAPPLQRNPVWAAQRLACPRRPDTHAHIRRSAAVTPRGHAYLLRDSGRRVGSVDSTYWSVSSWERAWDLANGSLRSDPWTHREPGWDLHARIGLQDWATRQSAAPFVDSIFFKATFQPFLSVREKRCHVWFLLSLVAKTPLVHVLSYVKNISILCCNTQYYWN